MLSKARSMSKIRHTRHLESYPPARIGQNGTYVSEHSMYYRFVNFWTFMNVYIHVHEFAYLYIPCTYMFMNVCCCISKVGSAYICRICRIWTVHYSAYWFQRLHIILHITAYSFAYYGAYYIAYYFAYYIAYYFAYICTNIQNNMQNNSSLSI